MLGARFASGAADRGEYRQAAGAVAAQDLMEHPRYNCDEWCWATEYTTMQQTQLLMFFGAVAAWIACGCILTRKPTKKLPLETLRPSVLDEHQPGCFALEEERGGNWKGSGGMVPSVKEAKPSL